MRKHTLDARINREKPRQAETAALLTVCPLKAVGQRTVIPILGIILIRNSVVLLGNRGILIFIFKNIALKFLLIANSFDWIKEKNRLQMINQAVAEAKIWL